MNDSVAPKSKERKPEDRASDAASVEMLRRAFGECVSTCYSRMDTQQNQCKFGTTGVCCRICHMGPCRITERSPLGVCGANADTIVARNYLRQVAAGSAAHSDHGRHLVLLLRMAAQGKGDYTIKSEPALRSAAELYGIKHAGRSKEEVAGELADLFLEEFRSQEETLKTLKLAPAKRQGIWDHWHLRPEGIDRMIVESLHRTHMGVDHDYENILLHAFRTSLADGWGGSRVATITSDILFGNPVPIQSRANLGVLGRDTVNVVVHGHEPALSEMLAAAASDPAIRDAAQKAGAKEVRLAGICCTANEILMRHGISIAGSFLQQELAILTGAVELMITDVQCCMPSLPALAKSFHTEVVSTSNIAKTVGASHNPFDEDHAYESAKALLLRAIANYSRRDPAKVMIPDVSNPLVAGFSVESIKYMLGGTYRASFRPLNDAIMQGRIRGVAGIVGCNNPKYKSDAYTNELTKKLIEKNVLVLKTGCAAISSAKEGMLTPEAALAHAGAGLREVCEAVGMPPVLHMGSCVDNSRILEAATEMVLEGGLGDDLSDIPAVGVAPEWMSEKAIAIGCYFVASGVDVILGHPFYVSGSGAVDDFLHHRTSDLFGASFHVCPDPEIAAAKVLGIIEARREKLGINKKTERKLFGMEDRRKIVEKA